MQLVIDIGNSFIKLAIFEQAELLHLERKKKLLVKDVKVLHAKYPFKKCISSSVRIKNPYALQHLAQNYHLTELKSNTKLPIKIHYKTPKTLGLDRVAAVVGAYKHYKQKQCLVIDIGTCVTYDFIDDSGNYLGGNIAPGVELRLRAMDEFTSALPLVKRKWNPEMLGVSTKSALQNGAVWGLKLEIESFIKTLTKERGKTTVILTGGDARYFGELIDSRIFVDSNLVLKGLNEILQINN